MNKVLSKITKSILGLSLAFGVAIFTTSNKLSTRVDAGEAVAYTLDGAVTGTGSGYASENSVTVSGILWKVNGNTTYGPWRIGGNKNNGLDTAGVIRHVQSQATVSSQNISKIVVSTKKPSSGSISPTDVGLKVGTSAGGSQTSSLSNGSWESTVTFNRPAGATWSGKYFEIDFTMPANTTTTNKYIEFVSATFYYESTVQATSLSVGAVSTYPGHTASVSVSPLPSGSVLPSSLTYSSSDTSIFTVSDGVVAGVSAGSATLRVESSTDSSVYGTATITVTNYPSVDSRVTVNGSNKYAIYATNESTNYSLSGVTSNAGTSSAGVIGSVNIDTRFTIVNGIYTNTIALKTPANKYLGYRCELTASGNNELNLYDEVNEYSSWVVTNEKVIPARSYGTNTLRHLSMNYNSGNPRFACYSATSSSYIAVSFYEIVIQSLTGISVTNVSLYPGHEKALSISPVPAAGSLEGATYAFSSATPAVATVDENGVVSAVATGSSVITITSSVGGNDYLTTATVTVQDYPAASGLTLNSSYVITGELESTEYELTGIDTEHNCGIATAVSGSYSKSLVMRPVEGYYTNTIAFEAVDGSGYLKSTKSSSNLTLATKLALNTSWVVSYSNSTFSVISAETYEEASQRHLLLNKNTTNGVANPRFGCYGGTSSSIVNINFLSAEVAATDFSLSESEVTIYKTQAHGLEVTFTPNNTTDRTLSWSTSDSSVATVSDGVITGVGPGTAVITASKTIGGNAVSRTCNVTVKNNVATHTGTVFNPYTVEEAVYIAKGFFTEYSNGNPVNKTGVYVKGIVTNLTYKSTSSISFWIGDDISQTSSTTGGFEVYSASTIMGKSVTERYESTDAIDLDFAPGYVVTASGNITLYNSTVPEFEAGCSVTFNNHIEAVNFATSFNLRGILAYKRFTMAYRTFPIGNLLAFSCFDCQ